MIITSFQKEWLIFQRDGRLFWIFVALLLMMVFGIFSSSHQYQNHKQLQAQAKESDRSRWINQGEKNPHSAAHYGVYVFKPDTPLAVIDPGVSDYQGNIVFLEAHKRSDAAFQAIQDSIELQRFGTISPATILQLLLPLFVILTGFTFFAGEREQGTLRMLLLSGQSPRQIFYQKAAALYLLSSLFLLPILGYISTLFAGNEAADGQRLITLCIVYLFYILFWVLLTLVVSIFICTARKVLTVLLIVWALTSLIVPKLAMDMAVYIAPTISNQEFYARMESDLYTPERLEAIEQFKKETLKKYGVNSTDELTFNWAGAELLFNERYSDKVFDQLFNSRTTALQQQTSIYQLTTLLSPFIGIQVMSSGLSTTDWYHHHLYTHAAEQYRRAIIQTLNSNVRDNQQEGYKADETLWSSIVEFTYITPEIKHIIKHYFNALSIFFGWIIAALVASQLAIHRLSKEGQ